MDMDELVEKVESEARLLAGMLFRNSSAPMDCGRNHGSMQHAHAALLNHVRRAKIRSPRYDFNRHLAALRLVQVTHRPVSMRDGAT